MAAFIGTFFAILGVTGTTLEVLVDGIDAGGDGGDVILEGCRGCARRCVYGDNICSYLVFSSQGKPMV